MSLSISDIITSAFSSPGMPKMWVTPSVSRHLTRRSDAFMQPPWCGVPAAPPARVSDARHASTCAGRTMRLEHARVNASAVRLTSLFE